MASQIEYLKESALVIKNHCSSVIFGNEVWKPHMAQIGGEMPCPHRIFEDTGAGFSMGAILGVIIQTCWLPKYPKGMKLASWAQATRSHGIVMGGNFATWGMAFSSFACLISIVVHNNLYSNILAGAGAGYLMGMKGGRQSAIQGGIMGGIFLGVIELVGEYFQSANAEAMGAMAGDLPAPPATPPEKPLTAHNANDYLLTGIKRIPYMSKSSLGFDIGEQELD